MCHNASDKIFIYCKTFNVFDVKVWDMEVFKKVVCKEVRVNGKSRVKFRYAYLRNIFREYVSKRKGSTKNSKNNSL